MNNPIEYSLSSQIEELYKKIRSFNKKGDLYGLFSYHILSELVSQITDWHIFCDDDWIKKSFDKDNVYNVAELGYSTYLNNNVDDKIIACFAGAFENLKKRDLFSGSHVTFPYNPLVFLGLVLGIKSLPKSKKSTEYSDWLISVLKERLKRGKITQFQDIFYNYVGVELRNNNISITLPEDSSLDESSFFIWGIKKGYFTPQNPSRLDSLESSLLYSLLKTDIHQIEPEKTSIILFAANSVISGGINRILRSPSVIVDILSKFESSMKRWRFDNDALDSPIKWPIKSEKEVQDILWIILRPYFVDLIDEETLPKLGHSSYKPDFAIPSLRTLVEVKFAIKRTDFKDIEKEIMQDSVGYLTNTNDYERIIVFIYDHSCSTQEHDETKRALKKVSGIEDVIIVSRPSQLPS